MVHLLGIYFFEKQFVLVKYFIKNEFLSTTAGLVDFTFFQITFLNHCLAVIFTIDSLILTGVLGLLAIVIAHFRLMQMQKFATQHDAQLFPENIVIFFLNKNNEFLYILQSINHIFGKAYFSFLLLNCPSNAFLVMSLLINRKISVSMQIFLIITIITQIFFIFILHYVIAYQFRKIHHPAVFFFSVIIKGITTKTFLTKLKLAHYLEHFHTKYQYGFALGRFGYVCYQSFGKVLHHFETD